MNEATKVGVLVSLFPWTSALAANAGFDCAKAASKVEKLICSSDSLSGLDKGLSLLYGALQSSSHDDDLKKAQLAWLKQRNACDSNECLYRQYDARLSTLLDRVAQSQDRGQWDTQRTFWNTVFPDSKVTCEQQRRIPAIIFSGYLDLGSGSGSSLDVDYGCKEGLSSLPFMSELLAKAEDIRSEDGAPQCTGTMKYAVARYYQLDLLQAGIAPDITKKNEWTGTGMPVVWSYFASWATHSPSNYRDYTGFMSEYKTVLPVLASHYETTLHLDKETSLATATRSLDIVVRRAAGVIPRDSEQISTLANLLNKEQVDESALRQALAEAPDQKHIQQALVVALANNMESPIIDLILNNTKNETLNSGDESPLFFALNNIENAKRLITRGARVDYQNRFGKTPLFYAIENQDIAVITFLLDAGANPNHTYKNAQEMEEFMCWYNIQHTRRTPLMHAAQHATPEIITLLIKRGATLEAKDDPGFNALDYAIGAHNTANVDALKKLGLTPGKTTQ